MGATEELRRLLDGRGVIWEDKTNDGDRCDALPGDSVTWWFDRDDVLSCARENFGHRLALRCECTPWQAVEATLGRGTCKDVCAGISEFACSSCGFRCDIASWETLFDGDDGRHRHHHHGTPNYCPNCGRKVVHE